MYQSEEEIKYLEWVKSLKAGDTVCYDEQSGFNARTIHTVTIEKITPSGMLKLSNGMYCKVNGRIRSYGYRIYAYTEEVKARVAKATLVTKAKHMLFNVSRNDSKLNRLSTEQLEPLVKELEAVWEIIS